LIEAGYRVCGLASTGEDAVRLATEESPDLILMDIRLQGEMTGVQAARAIWEAQQIPIVFVTANADASTLDEVKKVPNYGYVVKPLHSASIQAVVELALDRREKEFL
jgi:two-component system cell cycle sensor histidine kinase/response regulator CckA